MERFSFKVLRLLCGVVLGTVALNMAVAQGAQGMTFLGALSMAAVQSATPDKPSFTKTVASKFKQGLSVLAGPSKVETLQPEFSDAISLAKPSQPSTKTYVAVANLYVSRGRLKEAALQFENALKHTPDDLGALLGYAKLKDRADRTEESLALYHRAAKQHPDEPSVFNNLGAFHGRRGQYAKAVAALKRAIELAPREARYHNNLAVVYVEMGRSKDAYTQLRSVANEATTYYNLGYLLNKRGEAQRAAQHFAMALKVDPSMAPARQMLQIVLASSAQQPKQLGRPQTPPLRQKSLAQAGQAQRSSPQHQATRPSTRQTVVRQPPIVRQPIAQQAPRQTVARQPVAQPLPPAQASLRPFRSTPPASSLVSNSRPSQPNTAQQPAPRAQTVGQNRIVASPQRGALAAQSPSLQPPATPQSPAQAYGHEAVPVRRLPAPPPVGWRSRASQSTSAAPVTTVPTTTRVTPTPSEWTANGPSLEWRPQRQPTPRQGAILPGRSPAAEAAPAPLPREVYQRPTMPSAPLPPVAQSFGQPGGRR